jgi:glucokinase
MRIIAADIGGTKTLLALAEADASGVRVIRKHRFDSAAFATFEAMLAEFLAADSHGRREEVERACFAVAGPISADGLVAQVTNLTWGVDARRIERDFAIGAVRLINDFEAQAYGIGELAEGELLMLQAGVPQPRAPRLVLGAGTGLGVCQMAWCEDRYRALPSEGGHADFAPNGTLQEELLSWLRETHEGHVSVERVLSGAGLVNIYRFLKLRHPSRGAMILDQLGEGDDAAAAISSAALAESPDRLAQDALDLFVSIYGACAGSLALITLPFGGVYVAGGIAPRILPAMTGGRFMAAFNDKGRMSRLTTRMRVSIVMNPEIGLAGALEITRHPVEA